MKPANTKGLSSSFDRLFKEKTAGEMIALKANPVFDSLRADPRFLEFLQRAGFSQ